MRERVVVAMSGGVDSSVAAALLVEQGYEVIGITMEIWPELSQDEAAARGGCCGLGAVLDARAVADRLGIPHYTLNFREEFQRDVVEYFAGEYAAGRTPNPCIACNQKVKFKALLERAEALGARYLATGHYARVRRDADGYRLVRAADPRKDQTYVLYGLGQRELSRVLFPVGEMRKDEVRAKARALGLITADKPDSQEICFVAGDYRAFLAQARPEALRPGRFRDVQGRDLGPSPGIGHFTVGQRRGIRLSAPEPYYVVALRPQENVVVVGTARDLFKTRFRVEELRQTGPRPLPEVFSAAVQIRAHAPCAEAEVRLTGPDSCEVEFRTPQRAISPGQAAVLYDGDVCLGGGRIAEVA